MTIRGRFRIYFNRHQAAPLVWCVTMMRRDGGAETPVFEIAVRQVASFVEMATVYQPKETSDADDGMPSAWIEADGVLYVDPYGLATIRKE